MNEKILIVEDEKELADIIFDFLESERYYPLKAYDANTGLSLFKKEKPDLILLDIMLPDLDGMEFCTVIRKYSDVPIIMLSAKISETDKILGLGLGSDDYITKPVGLGELLARIKANLRRYKNSMQAEPFNQINDIQIYPNSYKVSINGNMIYFSGKEFQILELLVNNRGQVFTKENIFDKIWGYNEYGDINTVTVHIRKIRAKIEEDPKNPKYIKTVWGVGYKFDP